MLELIIGRSGCGKSTEVYRRLKSDAEQKPSAPLYLLVPEQASYENERRLLTELGPVLSQRVQVLSFTRMAETVFRNIGGIAGKRMDSTVSLLLMSHALHSLADDLPLYGRHAGNTEYLKALLAVQAECKQCAISPKQWEDTAAEYLTGALRGKAQEFSLIFSAYEALVAQAALVDPLDDLTVLANRLPECHLFDGARVYIDSFKGFTEQEFRVLQTLMPRVHCMTVALCTDQISQKSHDTFHRFSSAIRTAARLRDAAYEEGVPVAKTLHLTQNHRTADPALLALENGCFVNHAPVYDFQTNAVTVTPCTDRAEECQYAARTIRRLLREHGGHSRDFTIVARNCEQYVGLLDIALEQEGIPCHMDIREPILTEPLLVLLESALSAVLNGWDSADVLRLLKTGLTGFSTTSSSLLENYVFCWSIRGKRWLSPFTENPDGLSAISDNKTDKQLAYLNLLRRRLVRPLTNLQSRLNTTLTGKEFAFALFSLLTELRVPRLIRLQTARLENRGEHALAERQARIWDYTVELLDKFAVALPDTRLPAAKLAELFRLAVAGDDLGSVPQGLDGVQIGSADRIRYNNPKTVLILGANEGVFPAYPATDGLLTDRERKQLIQAGLPMADDADRQTMEERYYAYMAIAAPSERLIVTYTRTAEGEIQYPSSLVETIEHLLPHCQHETPEQTLPESETDAFGKMALLWRENSELAVSYREVFAHNAVYDARLTALSRQDGTFRFEDPAMASSLFGKQLRVSPSQIDTYHRCRFSYFCRYGLRAKPRQKAELNAAESGTLVHHVMQTLLPSYVTRGVEHITRSEIEQDTAETVTDYVNAYMGGSDTKDGRFLNLVSQLIRLSTQLMWRVVQELRQSRFVPIDYELPIGRTDETGHGIPPWILTLPDGTSIQVQGKVDRVDVYRDTDRTYIRIIDYKTGNKAFDLSEVMEGLNLQMLIYLFSICQNGTRQYGDTTPAGVLYLPAKLPVIRVDRNLPADEMERQRLATMCMSGLLIDDPQVLSAMEAELAGIFIPASVTKSGNLSSASSLASLQQFGYIKKHIENLLTQMAATLQQGDIAALPTGGMQDGCAYCDYRDICGHEPQDAVRLIRKQRTADVLSQLEKECE